MQQEWLIRTPLKEDTVIYQKQPLSQQISAEKMSECLQVTQFYQYRQLINHMVFPYFRLAQNTFKLPDYKALETTLQKRAAVLAHLLSLTGSIQLCQHACSCYTATAKDSLRKAMKFYHSRNWIITAKWVTAVIPRITLILQKSEVRWEHPNSALILPCPLAGRTARSEHRAQHRNPNHSSSFLWSQNLHQMEDLTRLWNS